MSQNLGREKSPQQPGSKPAWEPDLVALPDVVQAPRTDAVYNCHSYLTKVPISAITPFIETLSREGESVADIFAGSGMTGLAAARSNRTAHLSDISVLGRHIAHGYLVDVPAHALRQAANDVVGLARSAIGNLYLTRRVSDGELVEMIRTIWSFVYRCPKCSGELVYFEQLQRGGSKQPSACLHCEALFSRRSWPKGADVPVRVVVTGEAGKQIEQPIQSCDLDRIARAATDSRWLEIPSSQIGPDREMYSRSGLGRAGLAETKQFFSARNALALLELWRAINALDQDSLRTKLRFAFTAILTRASRRYQWSAMRPLNAQNQTYYIAPVYFEWNVFDLFRRKVEAVVRSDELLFRGASLFPRSLKSRVQYSLASADALSHLPDQSIDYVFTDPPFGSNIFYSDMNLFHEAWIGELTDQQREAVIRTTGGLRHEATQKYERLLQSALREVQRVLKPGRYMSLVFGNSSGRVWALVQRALREAGFLGPVHVAILDKGQRSVKGLNSGSEGVVTVDLVLTVQKPTHPTRRAGNADTPERPDVSMLLVKAADDLSPADRFKPSYVYVAAIREGIRRGLPLDDLHYSEVLVTLRRLGYKLNPKTGLLTEPFGAEEEDLKRGRPPGDAASA